MNWRRAQLTTVILLLVVFIGDQFLLVRMRRLNDQLLALVKQRRTHADERVATIGVLLDGQPLRRYEAPKGGYAEVYLDADKSLCIINLVPGHARPASYGN